VASITGIPAASHEPVAGMARHRPYGVSVRTALGLTHELIERVRDPRR
jgi:hypothetical protein